MAFFFQIILHELTALRLQEGDDEIYAKVDGVDLRPHSDILPDYWHFQHAGDKLPLNRAVFWGTEPMFAYFQLWEQDFGSHNMLGEVGFWPRGNVLELELLPGTTRVFGPPPWPDRVTIDFHLADSHYRAEFIIHCARLDRAGCEVIARPPA